MPEYSDNPRQMDEIEQITKVIEQYNRVANENGWLFRLTLVGQVFNEPMLLAGPPIRAAEPIPKTDLQ